MTLREGSTAGTRHGLDPQMRMEVEAPAPAPAAEPAAPVEVVTPEAAAPVVEPTEPAAEPQGADKWDDDTRKYIEDLRKESAGHRTRAAKFEDTFKEWPDDAVSGFLTLAQAIAAGDKAAAPVLESLLKDLTPAEAEALKEAAGVTGDEQPKFMTPEQVEEFIKQREESQKGERDKQEAESKALTELKGEIETLGFDVESANPDATLLFFFAKGQEGEGARDWKAAAKQVEEFKQTLIDEYVGKVVGRKSKFARVPTAGSTPAGTDGGAKNLGLKNGNSKRAMTEFLNAQA